MTIKEYVRDKKQKLKEKIDNLSIKPCFAIVQVNDDEASNAYIRGKLKDASEVGIEAKLFKLSSNSTQDDVLKQIDVINKDDTYHGLIVQMPLPKQIDEELIKRSVYYKKDIDGFSPLSWLNACTPSGILHYLKDNNIEIKGKNAVVIGRSNIVGRPMARLLLNESANVTVLHSKTSEDDMRFYVEHADIIVVAVGKKYFLDNRFNYKKSAVIIDVGINRIDGHLYGDVVPNLDVKLQTPVPGGVGLLTRLALLNNLMEAYEDEISNS